MSGEYKLGERVQYRYRGGEYPGNGPATVIRERADVLYAAVLRLDATGEEMPALHNEIHPIDWQPNAESEAAEAATRLQGRCAEVVYAAARLALASGMTRSEWDATAAFWFGQAAADHGHAVTAQALADARGEA